VEHLNRGNASAACPHALRELDLDQLEQALPAGIEVAHQVLRQFRQFTPPRVLAADLGPDQQNAQRLFGLFDLVPDMTVALATSWAAALMEPVCWMAFRISLMPSPNTYWLFTSNQSFARGSRDPKDRCCAKHGHVPSPCVLWPIRCAT